MASKEIKLPLIQKGWFMGWNMTTQAGYKICVTLKDTSTIYVNNACKASTDYAPPLSSDIHQVMGDNLTLLIDIKQAKEIKLINIPFVMPDESGNNVCYGYNIAVEDAGDMDYNDLSINITAWKSRG